MKLFTLLEDAIGIVKLPKGVHKQVKLYSRGRKIYVPHAGGYVQVTRESQQLNGGEPMYETSHPDIKLIEHNLEYFVFETQGSLKQMLLPQEDN